MLTIQNPDLSGLLMKLPTHCIPEEIQMQLV